MIKAVICEKGKVVVERNYKFLTVKDIHDNMRQQYGKPLSNTHSTLTGRLIVQWNFKDAIVRLEGANIHVGYRTKG